MRTGGKIRNEKAEFLMLLLRGNGQIDCAMQARRNGPVGIGQFQDDSEGIAGRIDHLVDRFYRRLQFRMGQLVHLNISDIAHIAGHLESCP